MNKFRKWLIHKLGGVCKDEFVVLIDAPKASTQEKKIERIKAQFVSNDFEYISQEEIKEILLDNIRKGLSNYYFEIKELEYLTGYAYTMELEFVLQ